MPGADNTRRRSTRGQVAVKDSLASGDNPITTADPIFKRTTVGEDLTGSQFTKVIWKIEDKDLETRFFDSFTREEAVRRERRVYGKAGRDVAETATYKVGDTVLLETSSREPSVAVIVSIWKVFEKEKEQFVNVRLHWFSRLSDLAQYRPDHPALPNEVYYQLSGDAVISAYAILGHCTVAGVNNGHTDGKSFFCALATHPRRGFYYELQWDAFRQEALKVHEFWESSAHWDVIPGETPFTPKKPRTFDALARIDGPVGHLSPVAEEEDAEPGPSTPSRKRKADRAAFTTPRRKRPRNDAASQTLPALRLDPNELAYLKTPTKSRTLRPSQLARPSLVESQSEGEDEGGDEYTQLHDSDDEASNGAPEDEQVFLPRTPSRRKRGAIGTPRVKRTGGTRVAAPTPHSKAALRARATRKRAMAIRPPPPDGALDLAVENLPDDPWLRAMHVLHVASRPEAHRLPCREDEYARILRSVEELLEEGSGGCIYISGVPGTGKTATVHAVVRELKRMAEHNEANPFTYVEINGLRIPEPSAAYGLLWEAVSGHNASQDGHLKMSSKESLKKLTRHFAQGDRIGPAGHACVVLMDELDQLMTTKQDVVYNFFNWPTIVGSKLIVLAVANTMDLPERVMTGRVRSRLGMVRINFQPYTTPQLEKIVQSRLTTAKQGLPDDTPNVITPDGIKLAAMKVSSISGDARRVLDICRRTVELVQPQSRAARADDVKQVIKDMQNSPTAAYLGELTFHERLMLAALLRCVKREGVEEVKWGDIQHQHLLHVNVLADNDEATRRPTYGELGMILDSLLASRAVLCEDGAVVARKPEEEKRVMLNLEHTEVERVLAEVGGDKWKNVLNI